MDDDEFLKGDSMRGAAPLPPRGGGNMRGYGSRDNGMGRGQCLVDRVGIVVKIKEDEKEDEAEEEENIDFALKIKNPPISIPL